MMDIGRSQDDIGMTEARQMIIATHLAETTHSDLSLLDADTHHHLMVKQNGDLKFPLTALLLTDSGKIKGQSLIPES